MPINCCICTDNLIVAAANTPAPGTAAAAASSDYPCATRCGHVFHNRCLRNWLEHANNNTCPQCRQYCDGRNTIKLFMPCDGSSSAPNRVWEQPSLDKLLENTAAMLQRMEAKRIKTKSMLGRQLIVLRVSCEELQDRNERLESKELERNAIPHNNCQQSNCGNPVASRLWCPHHAICTARCRVPIAGLSMLRSLDNGEMFCQSCATVKCANCKARLTGTCAKLDNFVYHERCFPCIKCKSPMGRPAGTLHTSKMNRFHEDCFFCDKCGKRVQGFVQFRGLKPWCGDCNQA